MAMTLAEVIADRTAWDQASCSVAKAVDAVGSRATILLLREALYGTTRFDDFVARIGIAESVATARLKQLVDLGVLEKRPYREPGARARYEYVLTDMGAELLPVVLGLMQWANKYLQPDGGPVRVVDRATGAPVTIEAVSSTGVPLALEELLLVPTVGENDQSS